MSSKNNSKNLSVIIIILLLVVGYFLLNSNGFFEETTDEIEIVKIPDGVYSLTNKRPDDAALCNLSFLNYGKTITVSGGKAYTTQNLIQEVDYDVKHQSGNAFKIGPANSICFYNDGKLIFTCNGKEILFEKQ